MFCQQCGKELTEDSKFCTSCGAPVPSAFHTDLGVEQTGDNFAEEGISRDDYTQPVYRAAEPQPMHAQQNAAYQPAYASQTAGASETRPASRKRTRTRWPASAGTMGVLHLVFYLAALVPLWFYFDSEIFMGVEEFLLGARLIFILLAIAVPVLFFVHTKKIAFITAIPMVINLIFLLVNTFQDMDLEYLDPMMWVQNVVLAGFEVILVILYVIQMFVRAHNPAMPIIYLILSILELLVAAVFTIGIIVESLLPQQLIAYEVLNYVASIFLTVTYCIAMFSSRKR